MVRRKLITNERTQQAYEGKINDDDWDKLFSGSIYDDLDSFFNNFKEQTTIESEIVRTFFTPQLTDEERKLVEEKNQLSLSTYSDHFFERNPDVDVAEMENSASEYKYVQGHCFRSTTCLTPQSNRPRVKNETPPEQKMKHCHIL